MLHIKLKYLREQADLTREQLAPLIGVTYSSISKYETNKRQPDLETLKKIASFFNVSTDYLLDNPYSHDAIMNDISLYFDLIKDIVKSQDDVYFKSKVLSDTSKGFVHDTIEYISNQIIKINNDK